MNLSTFRRKPDWACQRPGFLQALRGNTGAIDLASIMVGVIVIGVLATTIAATVFAVIPWAQDNAAKSNLDSYRLAQSVAQVNNGGKFVTENQLIDGGLLTASTAAYTTTPIFGGRGASVHAAVTPEIKPGHVTAALNDAATCYVAAVQSDSGKVFYTASDNPTISAILPNAAAPLTNCADVAAATSVSRAVFPTIANIGVQRLMFTATDGTTTSMYSYDENGVTTKEDAIPARDIQASVMFQGNLYFAAQGLNGLGKQIYEYNGSQTKLVKQFDPVYDPMDLQMAKDTGDYSRLMDQSRLRLLSVYDNKLLFQATDAEHGDELWSFDGTNYTLVSDINPGAQGSNIGAFAELGGVYYFAASAPTADGGWGGLWKFDGANVAQVVYPTGATTTSQVGGVAALDGVLYFTTAGEVKTWNGSSFSTISGVTTYEGLPLAVAGSVLYISARGGAIEGTYTYSATAGLKMVSTSATYLNGLAVNSSYYHAGYEAGAGMELVRLGLTGQTLAADIEPGVDGSNPGNFVAFGNKLMFSARKSGSGCEVWSFDGSNASMVSDINPGAGESDPVLIGIFK